jgi:hypothetical protein
MTSGICCIEITTYSNKCIDLKPRTHLGLHSLVRLGVFLGSTGTFDDYIASLYAL